MNTEVIFQRNNNSPGGNADRKKWISMPGLVGENRQEGGGSFPPLDDIKEEDEAVRTAVRDKRGRRKSWHSKLTGLPNKPKDKLSKAERKRRQGVVSTTEEGDEGGDEDADPMSPLSPLAFDRHKRRSWWNIFIPEDFPTVSKSRRSSTDIGRPSLHPTHTRSKSHSVDHGTASPIDLELLRSKMDRRFNSMGDSDGDGERERKPSAPPIKTIPYKVQSTDTLNSVAARFDITPSELRKLNRLASNLIFPGSTLLVPDKSPGAEGEEGGDGDKSISASEEGNDSTVEEREILDNLRPVSPKPGYVERQTRRPDPREARFLKINVRHITDGQGVVSGVVLVTPNAVMFDPNVSDPLVIEHGPESYGVIAPMEYVVNAAIYHDIAHMRVGQSGAVQSGPQPEIYYTKTSEKELPSKRDCLLVKEQVNEKASSEEENDSLSSYEQQQPPAPLAEGHTEQSQQSDAAEQVSAEKPCEGVRLQERRASSIDQHWAVPKRKTHSDSLDSQPESDSMQLGETAGGVEDCEVQGSADEGLTKLSCHDSGIDIRESGPSEVVIPPTRKTRSDADVILAGKDECVLLAEDPTKQREKDEKQDGAGKTKMLKRLSYPLSWMEGSFVSESKDEKDSLPSLPTSADSQHSSVFSKVFSSSPKTFVSDIGSGIVDLGSGIGSGIVDIGSGIGSGIVDIGSGIGTGIVNVGTGIGTGIVDIGSGIGSGIVDIGSGIGSGLSDLGSNLFLMKTPSEDSGGSKSPGTRSPITPKFPPQPPNTPAYPIQTSQVDASGRRDGPAGRSSVGTFMRSSTATSTDSDGRSLSRTNTPKLDYRSMVSVDDMPDLFASIDKLLPRPARSCDDPPLYLRLRMGKPLNKKIPKSTPIMSYGKKRMRPEYWFSVPRNRVDELYHFLQVWVPHLYGDLDQMDVTARGFELIESDTELWDENGGPEEEGSSTGDGDELGDISRPSWEMVKAPYVKLYAILRAQTGSADSAAVNDEVLSMSEELRRALYASSVGSLDLDLFIPDLVGVTEILNEDHRRQLARHLPARAEGYVWTLVFSTSQHGFSLNSLYRKMGRVESPILLVVQDTDNNVFGAITSCSLKMSDYFYGTGESLLFRFNPEFNVYHWTGDNMYFIKGNNESLAIGAGDGKFGLWLDGDLYQGRSERCSTYDNAPLSSQEDFVVKTLECWAFL